MKRKGRFLWFQKCAKKISAVYKVMFHFEFFAATEYTDYLATISDLLISCAGLIFLRYPENYQDANLQIGCVLLEMLLFFASIGMAIEF